MLRLSPLSGSSPNAFSSVASCYGEIMKERQFVTPTLSRTALAVSCSVLHCVAVCCSVLQFGILLCQAKSCTRRVACVLQVCGLCVARQFVNPTLARTALHLEYTLQAKGPLTCCFVMCMIDFVATFLRIAVVERFDLVLRVAAMCVCVCLCVSVCVCVCVCVRMCVCRCVSMQ